jgi:hypothetical protein
MIEFYIGDISKGLLMIRELFFKVAFMVNVLNYLKSYPAMCKALLLLRNCQSFTKTVTNDAKVLVTSHFSSSKKKTIFKL